MSLRPVTWVSRVAWRRASALLALALVVAVLPATPAAAAATFQKTLAGPSLAAMYPSGLEYDDANGRIVVADTGRDRILFYAPDGTFQGGFGEHGTGAGQFDSPRDAAVEPAGNIYVADAGNDRVQGFTSTGVHLWTVGGIGSCNTCLNTPIGVTWDTANNVLLVASTGQDRIKAFDAAGNWVWSSPTGPTLGIDAPRDAIRGPDGRVWVADYKNHQIKAFDVTVTGVWTSNTPAIVLGQSGGGSGVDQLKFPYNVDFSPDGTVAYVSDTANDRVARWNITTSAPTWLSPFGSSCSFPCPDPPADIGKFEHLRRGVVDPSGKLITADLWGNGLQVWNPDGTVALQIEGAAAGVPGFAQAFSVSVAPDGTTYVIDRLNQRVERFDAAGNYLNTTGARGTGPGRFSWPEGAAAASGAVYVIDTRNDRIQRFQSDLTSPQVIGSTGSGLGQFNYPEGGSVGPDGKLYVADTRNDRIQVYDPVSATFTAFGSQGSGPGQFQDPEGVAVTSTNVFVADTGNNRIQKFDLAGSFVQQFSAGLSAPEGVAAAPDGTVWVADAGNHRLLQLSAALVDLGHGFGGFGTGNYQFNLPHSLAISGSSLFVADTYNNRVQVYDVGTLEADTTPPDAQVTTPAPNETLPNALVTFRGTATDNAGIARVQVAIKDRDSGLWYRTGGTWGAFQNHDATLVSYGAASTEWTFGWTPPPAGGNFALSVTTTDGSGNKDPTKPWVPFSVSGGAFNPMYSREISDPGGVAPLYPADGDTDAAGNRYVADSGGSRIVKIDPSGVQTTVLGTGLNDPRGVDFDAGDPNVLWVVNTSDSNIKRITTSGTVLNTFGGPSVFKTPYGLDNDSTGVYVADTYNNRIVKMDRSTGSVIWSLSTCGGVALKRPRDLTIGSDGRIYAADTDNNRIVVANASTGACVTTFGSRGSGNNGFRAPRGITSDGTGRLFIADALNYRVKVHREDGTFVSQFNAGFGEGNGQFRSAHCVFLDGALVDVCDTFNYRIQRFSVSAGGALSFHSIVGGVGPTNTGFNGAFDAAYGPSGELYAADWFNHRILKFAPDGTFERKWGGYGSPNGSLIFPRGIVVTPDGNTVVVTDSENNRIDLFQPNGTFVSSIRPATGTKFLRPHQTALAPDGTYWVADTGNNRAVHLNGSGTVLGTITGLSSPRGIGVDGVGNVYVANSGQSRILKYSSSGTLLATLATSGSGPTNVRSPYGLRIVGAPGSEMLLIADAGNNRIVAMTLAGGAIGTFGSAGSGPGQFNSPRGVSQNPVTSEVAVADFANNRISVWTT